MKPSATPDPRTLLRHFASRQELMLADLEDLLRLDTPSLDAPRIREFLRVYRGHLEGSTLSFREIESEAGPHLFGEAPGRGPPLALVAHSDTVWPAGEAARRPPRLHDGRLFAPGVFDMRAGLALVAWALRYLAETGVRLERGLILFVSADEELASRTGRRLMADRIPADATALIPEPPCPDGSVKIARKGVGIFEVRIRGREAHAGVEPEKGASAIREAARFVLESETLTAPDRGVQLNVGTISGGTATNVVAGEARLGIDVRFDRLEDGVAMEERLRAWRPRDPATTATVTGGLEFPPMVPTDRSRRLAARAVELARQFGLDFAVGSSGGGSDGSHLAARGVTVLDGLGVEGGGAHALDEHIRLEHLARRAAFFTGLVLDLCRAPE